MRKGPLRTFLRGRKHPSDLIITIILSVIGAVSALIMPDGNMFRILLGLPLLLFLPGYAMISMMYPARYVTRAQADEPAVKRRTLDNTERLIFSVGLNLILVSLVGLVLNYVSSITLVPILMSLVGLTIAFSAVAWYLRYMLPEEERFRYSFLSSSQSKKATKDSKTFTALLVCGIVLVASILVYMIVSPADNSSYSEFYLLDRNGMLESLPNNLTVNQTGIVLITIHSLEQDITNYRIIAGVENATAPIIYADANNRIVLPSDKTVATNVTLARGGTYEQQFAFSFPEPGRYKIVWELMIDGEETEYQLHLWVNVT